MDAFTKNLIGIALCVVVLALVVAVQEARIQHAIERGEVTEDMSYKTVCKLWGKPDWQGYASEAPHWELIPGRWGPKYYRVGDEWIRGIGWYEGNRREANYRAVYYKDRDVTLVFGEHGTVIAILP